VRSSPPVPDNKGPIVYYFLCEDVNSWNRKTPPNPGCRMPAARDTQYVAVVRGV